MWGTLTLIRGILFWSQPRCVFYDEKSFRQKLNKIFLMLDPAGDDSFDSPLRASVLSVRLSSTFLSLWLKAAGKSP